MVKFFKSLFLAATIWTVILPIGMRATDLHTAVNNGDLQTVIRLVENGANIDKSDQWGRTALHMAARYGSIEIVKYLIEKGAKIDEKSQCGETALHLAAYGEWLKVVKYLVENGAKIDEKNKDGSTAFHYAAQKGDLKMVKYLVEKGAKIDEKDNKGQTTIHFAAQKGYLKIVKYLVENGAKIDKKNNLCKTARDIAHIRNYQEIENYLEFAEDFYRVVAGSMTFDKFIEKYDGAGNLADIHKLLHLGTRELADKFYDWCKKNNRFAVGDNWTLNRAWMYFYLAIGAQKLSWYLLALDTAGQDTSEKGKKLRCDMQETYAKSENLPLQKDYVKWVQENQNKQNLKKLAITSSIFTIKQLHDCKINFKYVQK